MAIFKKKQTRVHIPNRSNETTRLSSIYGEDANIRYLEDRINNMRNVDAYTKQESDNRFARLAVNNTFTDNQTIKGSTAFIEFKDGSNNRKGYIGKSSASSADVELKAETNSLTLGANHHVILRPGNNYQARYEKTPTEGVEIANKAYVDTKTGANKTILDQLDGRVNSNTRNIETNRNKITDLTTKVTKNISDITTNKNNINTHSTKISDLTTKITKNVSDIANNKTEIDKLKQAPQNVAVLDKYNTFTKSQKIKGDLYIQNPNPGDYGALNFYKSDGTTIYGSIGLERSDNSDFLISSKQRDLLLGAQRRVKSFVDMDMSGRRILNVSNPGANTDAATKQYVDDIAIVKKGYKNVRMKFSKVHIASGVFMYGSYGTMLEYMTLSDLKPNQRYEMVIRMRRIDGSRINLFLKAMEIITDTHGKVSILPYYFNDTEVVFIWNKDLKPGGSGETALKDCEIGYVLIPIK